MRVSETRSALAISCSTEDFFMFITDFQQLKQFKGIPGIYRFHFIKNNKNYIGESMDLWDRIYNQYRDSIKANQNRPVIHAIKKYGWENVQIELMDYGCHLLNQTCRGALETALIIDYDSLIENQKGYNVCFGGNNRQGRVTPQKNNKKNESDLETKNQQWIY